MKQLKIKLLLPFLAILLGHELFSAETALPGMVYLRDRKWDLRQIYFNNVPVDSLYIVERKISMGIGTDGSYYHIGVDSLTNQGYAVPFYCQIDENAAIPTIKVAQSADMHDVFYNFNIVYIGKDHLVLTFKQADLQNPSMLVTVEYRFVADNSVYPNTGSTGAP